jgi:hypothetical protein
MIFKVIAHVDAVGLESTNDGGSVTASKAAPLIEEWWE